MADETQFIRGFNSGYIFAQYLPELLVKIKESVKSNNEYFQGFISGSEHYQFEKSKDHLLDLKKIRTRGKDRSRERE